jgi:hypothetical protein
VFGGYFDDEFAAESKALFDEIRAGRFTLVISETLLSERASEQVQQVLASIPLMRG